MMSNHCEHCGASLNAPQKLSVREIAVNTVCAMTLLAVLAPAVYFGDQWLECRIHHYFEHPVWWEPLEDWSLLRPVPGHHILKTSACYEKNFMLTSVISEKTCRQC